MIFTILVGILVAAITNIMILTIKWSVHINKVATKCITYGYGNYKIFKKEFSKYKWYKSFPQSLCTDDNTGYIHANTINLMALE